MTDPEIADLCRRIYERHQRALDLIFEHRPDLQSQISEYLVSLVKTNDEMAVYSAGKTQILFRPTFWDQVPLLCSGAGVHTSGRGILIFHWMNRPDRLDLCLYIGPGPTENREQLFKTASRRGKPFELPRTLAQHWNRIYNRHILHKADLEDADFNDLTSKIDQGWQQFLEKDLPQFNEFAEHFFAGDTSS